MTQSKATASECEPSTPPAPVPRRLIRRRPFAALTLWLSAASAVAFLLAAWAAEPTSKPGQTAESAGDAIKWRVAPPGQIRAGQSRSLPEDTLRQQVAAAHEAPAPGPPDGRAQTVVVTWPDSTVVFAPSPVPLEYRPLVRRYFDRDRELGPAKQ